MKGEKNIYIGFPIRGEDPESIRSMGEGIKDHLKTYGKVLTEHVVEKDSKIDKNLTDREIYERDMKWLEQSDLAVFEVTKVSHGVGYEIGKAAEQLKIPVLCLHMPMEKKLSAMIAGSSKISRVAEYKSLEEAKQIIDSFVLENGLKESE